MELRVYDTLPAEASAIRKSVFIDEQGFENEFDQTDTYATHLVMYDNGIPVGTCRLFRKEDASSYIIGRLAVIREYRGRAIGSKLLKAAEETAAGRHGSRIILHAQMQARNFYEKQGYIPYGDIELEENCPHIWMQKDLDEESLS